MQPILSILTPAIWERLDQSAALAESIAACHLAELIEHLVLLDDRKRSVGAKRQALLDSARGQYIAFCDDDDIIAHDYISHLLTAAQHAPDVITFEQHAVIDGVGGHIIFDATHPTDDPWIARGTARRAPWHVCAWRREIVRDCIFPDISYGEDLQWSLQARLRIRTARHIDRVLHTYRHSAATTAAPPPR